MTSSRIGKLAMVLALTLGITACGSSTTSPKMQIGNTAGTKASSPIGTSRPMEKDKAKPSDKPTGGAAKGADPAKVTKANYDKLTTGMSDKEARELLGPPTTKKASNDGMGTILTWQAGKKVITATFRDGRLTHLSEANINDGK